MNQNSSPVKFMVVIIIVMVATFFVFWKGMGVSCLTSVDREEFEKDLPSEESGSETGDAAESAALVTEE